MKKPNTHLVYSSETGRICPACNKPVAACACKKMSQAGPPGDGIVRISRETKGRKGKGVSLVTGAPVTGDELKQLAKELKQKCGSGGTVRDGVIEIQGDHRDVLVELLTARGWTVKRAGG